MECILEILDDRSSLNIFLNHLLDLWIQFAIVNLRILPGLPQADDDQFFLFECYQKQFIHEALLGYNRVLENNRNVLRKIGLQLQGDMTCNVVFSLLGSEAAESPVLRPYVGGG